MAQHYVILEYEILLY